MTNTISSEDKRRVSEALTKCAAATKTIEDNKQLADAAYNILAKELGDKPQLYKVACRTYNNCKALYQLNARSDDDRGEDFAVLNVMDMMDRLNKDNTIKMQKKANAPAVFSKVAKPVATATNLTKVASAEVPEEKYTISLTDDLQRKNYMIKDLEDGADFIVKTAAAVTEAEFKLQDSVERFVSALTTEPKEMRKEAAAKISAIYGELGNDLIERFNSERSYLAVDSYKGKYRGTPNTPDSIVYKTASAVKEAVDNLEIAARTHEEALADAAVMTLDYAKKYIGVHKQAGTDTLTNRLIGASMATDVVKSLPEILGYSENPDEDKYRKDILSTEFNNAMQAHAVRRVLLKLTTNPTIAKYNMPQIIKATNKALSELPANLRTVPATANYALIRSSVIDNLAKGGVPSGSDADKILNALNAHAKLRSAEGIIDGNTIA